MTALIGDRMNTTVLFFHPHLDSSRVNKALADAAEATDGVTVRYLYDLYPDFTIDIEREQTAIADADRIVWQFPMYWYSSPALLKQWEDDVLTYGWAYGSGGKALAGKDLGVAVSPGAGALDYTAGGVCHTTIDRLLLPFQTTSLKIGTRFLKPFVSVGSLSMKDEDLAAQRKAYTTWLTDPDVPTQPLDSEVPTL